MSRIRIATRESQLALWQANEVSRLLFIHHPNIEVEIIGMTTVNFVAPAIPIGPIKFTSGKQGTLQSARYTTYDKLLSAKEFMDLFK